jgi:peptide/nickel transport system substrate-binding protein
MARILMEWNVGTPGQVKFQILAALLALAVGGCGSPSSSDGPGSVAPGGQPVPSGPSRVTIAIGGEAPKLASKLGGGVASFENDQRFLSNSPLVMLDPRNAPQPYLASDLPSRERGTWTVNPDGTMATTWNIRANALWHDGQPLTSRDFQFALKVYQDPEIEVDDRQLELRIDRIESSADKTFTIHWKQLYLRADRLTYRHLEPLPQHLVAHLYESGDKGLFQGSPFWTSTDYVGTGPYRIVEWEKGAYRVYRGFDQYFLGRPKIDEVTVRYIPDQNAVMGHLLGGAVDVTVGVTLNQQAGLALKQEWDRTGDGRLIDTVAYFLRGHIQFEPARLQQPALLDPRVRRSLAYGIDRMALADAVTGGRSPAPEVPISPTDPLYDRVQQAIAKYSFDRGRALALVEETGWIKRGDTLVSARGEPFTLDLRSPQISDNQIAVRIMASDLGALGMQISQTPAPLGQQPPEYASSFPGISVIADLLDPPWALER